MDSVQLQGQWMFVATWLLEVPFLKAIAILIRPFLFVIYMIVKMSQGKIEKFNNSKNIWEE